MQETKKITRILHVPGAMRRSGVAVWLIQVLREIDRDRYQMDFAVQRKAGEACAYEEEIRTLGSRIIRCPSGGNHFVFGRNFARVLREYGPYDVAHCHIGRYSGLILRLAARHQLSIRIVHSHLENKKEREKTRRNFRHRLYLLLRKRWIKKYATHCLAVSSVAGLSLFGPTWETDSRSRIFPCGIGLDPFAVDYEQNAIRNELGIPLDATVIGHVGRFSEQKNHAFLLEIAAEVLKKNPRAWVLLVGEGKSKATIEGKVRQLGIVPRITFAGPRDDVPRLMKGAMDVFVFPSLFEGLGLVLIEAQAAGLPCVISNAVPKEADVLPELITRVGLEQSLKAWADATVNAIRKGRSDSGQTLPAIIQSPFNIKNNINILQEIYLGQK